MDDWKCSSDDTLERILQDPNSMSRVMQLEYLKRITDNFSDVRLLSEGGIGKVYKGELQNGKMIAVKKFKQLTNPDDQEELFMNELSALMRLRHPNIVRCVGYCSEKSSEVVKHNGILVLAESPPEMLLCLEYLTMGSLDKHLKDESSGLDWRTCYKIIKGVCCGLHYLHEECRPQNNDAFIIHLDLTPANILLDKNMVPKLAGFSLSKSFCDKKTQIYPPRGTIGYMAPEYISEGKISTKADIYSLGVVIIEIITGCKADPDIEQIINKWRNRLAEALSSVDCQQIISCLEIGKCCMKSEQNERPTTGEIIKKLSLESIDCSIDSEEGPLCKETKKSCHTPPENQDVGLDFYRDGGNYAMLPEAEENCRPSFDPRSAASSRPPLPFPPSRIPCSQWEKGECIGSGSYGRVYCGFNSEHRQFCAIKEVILNYSRSEEQLKQLNEEIYFLKHLSHPNIVQYYGSFTRY